MKYYNYFMTHDIEQIIRKCASCQEYQNAKQEEPLEHTEVPTRPWQIIGSDIFYYDSTTISKPQCHR